jgi:hypothetical protein
MSHRQSVHDLEALMRSFHSLIAVETVEEERVRAIVAEVAATLQQSFFEWSVASGFRRGHGVAIGNTHDALGALKHIAGMTGDAIYLLKDLGPHLGKPEVCRALRELAEKMTHTRSAIVLTGEPLELPRDIEGIAVRFAGEGAGAVYACGLRDAVWRATLSRRRNTRPRPSWPARGRSRCRRCCASARSR